MAPPLPSPGWFVIPGVQEGRRKAEEQTIGLEPVLAVAAGKSVLDLGCAEGLICKAFLDADAAMVHGVDCSRAVLAVAGVICPSTAARFTRLDLNKWETAGPDRHPDFADRYDIVLMLAVAHKVQDPERLFRHALALTGEWLAVRAAPVFSGKNGKPFDMMDYLAADFTFEAQTDTPRGEWVAVFRRR